MRQRIGISHLTLPIALALSSFLLGCGIASVREGTQKIEERFLTTFKGAAHSRAAQLLVHSDALGLHIKMAAGKAGVAPKEIPADADQPFHVASIGKVFTAVLTMQLASERRLALTDPAAKYLDHKQLQGLFVFEGKDYWDQVTIDQLLSHTSGAADYFEAGGSGSDKNSVLDDMLRNPDKVWTPQEILDFAAGHYKALGPPGRVFHYSDTGYILLGLILEKAGGKKFESLLEERILRPLGMTHTYMHLRSTPITKSTKPLSPMMLGDRDVTAYKSVTADWTGGGLISTAEDLLLFQQALVKGTVISKAAYESMRGPHKFMDGIYYGRGLMTVHFADMSILMPATPDLHGHSGLLSTLMFYSPEHDAHIIANLGSTDDIPAVFEMMFWMMQNIKEIKALPRP